MNKDHLETYAGAGLLILEWATLGFDLDFLISRVRVARGQSPKKPPRQLSSQLKEYRKIVGPVLTPEEADTLNTIERIVFDLKRVRDGLVHGRTDYNYGPIPEFKMVDESEFDRRMHSLLHIVKVDDSVIGPRPTTIAFEVSGWELFQHAQLLKIWSHQLCKITESVESRAHP